MADIHSRKTRSYNMSRIGAKDTKPEMIVRKFLHSLSFRYVLHDKRLAGKPDLVFPKFKAVVFIEGCFWHGHQNCKYAHLPKSNQRFWKEKIEGNVARDKRSRRILKKEGWTVIVVWECQLKPNKREKTLNLLLRKFL